MYSTKSSKEIYEILDKTFPNARCELNYNNLFELLIAVVLSAQTTDAKVNLVTPELFKKYKTPLELSKAEFLDVYNIIKPLGLANNKAKNIISLSHDLVLKFDSKIPSSIDLLTTLSGVGIKTASVMMVEGFNIPAVPVDTHVKRVSNRLGISNSNNVDIVREDIFKQFSEDLLCRLHILLIFFGRYMCKAKNPECDKCPFKNNYCVYKKTSL